jgi:para-aminobenzoate synthetase/4-amino-4-deoxychorismate lyase
MFKNKVMISYKPLLIESLRNILHNARPVVFLDSALPSAKDRYSYLFTEPVKILKTDKFVDVPYILDEVDTLSRRYWIAGFISYEAAYGMEEALSAFSHPTSIQASNLVWLGVFERPYRYDHAHNTWCPEMKHCCGHSFDSLQIGPSHLNQVQEPNPQAPPEMSMSFNIGYNKYAGKIKQIKHWLSKGHTYQVNFSFNALINSSLDPFDLYTLLRKNQKTPYCAYIDTGSDCILSFSPELFFRLQGKKIIVKPMKGTAPRGRWYEEDEEIKKRLSLDSKNRSENVMIVDLLRNDLGKIAKFGSVRTDRLFEVETHPTLHQMTSTVTATLRQDVAFKDIFRHIFPSGSVTGAPKIRTMEIIRSLERARRGVYCGAIGYIAPKRKAVFSVPIRTLQRHRTKGCRDKRQWTYNVGSGIVWDSSARAEWEECMTKCRFIIDTHVPDFEIFESILWNGRFVYLKEHLKRLKRSADFFGYTYSEMEMKNTITNLRSCLHGIVNYKVRVFLNSRGCIRYDYVPLDINTLKVKPIVFPADSAVDSKNVYLYHKTTYRTWYDNAASSIERGNCFDLVFFNENSEITEFSRANIFLQMHGKLYTPPIRCGLLPGILRERLIKNGQCMERVLKTDDLNRAEAVYWGNSVRGLVKVYFG